MREIEITIKTTLSAKCRAIDEHPTTAYADDRFPGLAIHGPWELFADDWRITHVPSGMVVASLPTRAAATAALEIIGPIQDWTRPQAEVAAHGEPGKARWLKARVAAAVEQVKRERDAAVAQAVKPGTIKAAALEAALGDFRCWKMRRAWRNRSNCTHGDWTARARKLLGDNAGLDDVWKLAAALYAAASDFSQEGRFTPATWPPHNWRQFSGRLRTYRAELPEKALSRGQYEARRKAARKSPPTP